MEDEDLLFMKTNQDQIIKDIQWLDEHREKHITNKDTLKEKGIYYQKSQFAGCKDPIRAFLIATSYQDGYTQALIDHHILLGESSEDMIEEYTNL